MTRSTFDLTKHGRANLQDPAAFREFERETRGILRERREPKGADRVARARRIAELERAVKNATDAIMRGGLTSPALGERLTEAEVDLKALTAAKRQDKRSAAPVTAMLPRALKRYRALVADLNAALWKDVNKARELLRQYFDGGMVRQVPNGSRAALDAVCRVDGRGLFKSLTGQGTIKSGSGGRI